MSTFIEYLRELFGVLLFAGLVGAIAYFITGVGKLCSWAWYKWWFSQVVAVGQERYAIFVVLPVVATVAGGATAVGIDRLTGPKLEPGTLSGWYLLGCGLALAVAVGFWALWLLTRRSTTSLISEALNQSRNVDQALTIVTRYIEKEDAREERSEWGRDPSVDDGGAAHYWLHAWVYPLLRAVVLAAVLVGAACAGEALLLHSGAMAYPVTAVFGLVVPFYAGATILLRGTKRPLFAEYAQRLTDKQRELATEEAQAASARAATPAVPATPKAALPTQHGTHHVDARLAALLAGFGAAAGLIAWRMSNGRRSA